MGKRYAPVKVNGAWEPLGTVPSRGNDRVVRVPGYTVDDLILGMSAVARAMPRARDLMRLPAFTKPISPPRSIAVIEAEIRWAAVPALRWEDV